jgi:hypothetical protein
MAVDEAAFMESRLSRYKPGYFFPVEDAETFAQGLDDLARVPGAGDSGGLSREFLARLAEIFRCGPVIIRDRPPRKTAGTDSTEVLIVYVCRVCGFMEHAEWMHPTADCVLDGIKASVGAILEHKYCPLCSSNDIESHILVLPQLDPGKLHDLS